MKSKSPDTLKGIPGIQLYSIPFCTGGSSSGGAAGGVGGSELVQDLLLDGRPPSPARLAYTSEKHPRFQHQLYFQFVCSLKPLIRRNMYIFAQRRNQLTLDIFLLLERLKGLNSWNQGRWSQTDSINHLQTICIELPSLLLDLRP